MKLLWCSLLIFCVQASAQDFTGFGAVQFSTDGGVTWSQSSGDLGLTLSQAHGVTWVSGDGAPSLNALFGWSGSGPVDGMNGTIFRLQMTGASLLSGQWEIDYQNPDGTGGTLVIGGPPVVTIGAISGFVPWVLPATDALGVGSGTNATASLNANVQNASNIAKPILLAIILVCVAIGVYYRFGQKSKFGT